MDRPQFMNKQNRVIQQDPTPNGLMDMHIKKVYEDLKRLGADSFDMHLPETHRLPYLINPGEQILGIVYGRYLHKGGFSQPSGTPKHGRGALVVTDRRVLFVDVKPLFLRCDEIPLDLISGVTYAKAGMSGTVTLRTRTGDYEVRSLNQRCAISFVDAIETVGVTNRGHGSY